MTLNAAIGSRIAKLRKEHHLTQEQLAEKLDISIKHCSAVERGISRLSLEYLLEISVLFDVSLDYLVKGTETNNTDSDYILSVLPPSIISSINSKNEEELSLLQDYLHLYTRIRSKKT